MNTIPVAIFPDKPGLSDHMRQMEPNTITLSESLKDTPHMHVETGHLVDMEKIVREGKARDRTFEEAGYVPVPSWLNRAARKKLAGKAEAHVSLTSGGKLAKFAAQKRKAKRKIAKQSRRKSR